jgi:hypothetical protein
MGYEGYHLVEEEKIGGKNHDATAHYIFIINI